jgi:hypothetical protein
MSQIADELVRIAEEAGKLRERLRELSRACAELRAQLSGVPRDESSSTAESPEQKKEDAPRMLQSVS